ncbi:Hachiman antiphage defense system protein HamA [Psychroserpens sp.]|uniref:Hachiman antiphage defense system protein HamA n=1 Tax=Psychroserpens sp. TaxID=2020870 RepID=UPI001AFFF9AE|nr:Hachiman antiphage defense system protein HamA [Psychroserpens sp.]MBO6606715.1 DUF1837 domain-containing protein [Psychroserpens sp.]MBO6632256.1 DUF1837 domain-containing protein [Psychroserpens sp.]MBO6653419.1 DUF1837 domain-containing protein [Psychroserpens sp.]MBO6680554.1 DUF1837 domain-containing protein [Psychroserpens sp.]MBO6750488.1 DUF1837 domain-containing protein [Psychroserpens sp.]
MKILNHFKYKKKKVTTLKLKRKEYDKFISKLPEHYTYSYIKEEDIVEHKKDFGSTPQEIHNEYIPDDPKLMSGEFGEILTQQLLIELYEKKGLNLEGMKKTLHKEAKNVANHGTDIVLFYKKEQDASDEDILISGEVKSKATPNKDSSIVKAVDGVEKDNINRLAETLIWIRRKYKEERNHDGYKNVQRFIDPVKTKTYKKHFKAIAVIDKNFKGGEVAPKKLPKIGDDFEILVVLIDELKSTYQKTLADTLNCIENV